MNSKEKASLATGGHKGRGPMLRGLDKQWAQAGGPGGRGTLAFNLPSGQGSGVKTGPEQGASPRGAGSPPQCKRKLD